MGSFLFKWPHAASEVYVTGTFDDWAKSQKLEKRDGAFEKLVELSDASEKILYKFVVDDIWTTDHTAPIETDASGNTNNVLLPEHIIKKSTGTVGGAASDIPGAFPETPAPGLENQTFNVAPIPATAGIGNPVSLKPGEKVPDPSTLTSNTISSTATTSQADYEKSASGAPLLPNPVTPAEQQGAGLFGLPEQSKNMIPESSLPIGTGAATSTEKDPGVMISGGGGAPSTAALAGAVPREPRHEATTVDSSAFGSHGVSHVPSGFGPGVYRGADADPTIRTGGGAASTAALAGQVPLEPSSVPKIVQESQAQAGFAPEASANPEAVQEKSAVEQQLQEERHVEPANAGDELPSEKLSNKAAEIAAGTVGALGAAGATVAALATSGRSDPTIRTGGGATTAQLAGEVPLEASKVPAVVQESHAKAGVPLEAEANPEAVLEKSAMEQELKEEKHVEPAAAGDEHPSETVSNKMAELAAGAAAGATAAVAAATAYMTTAKDKVQSGEAQEAAKNTAAQAQEGAVQAKDGAAAYAAQTQEAAAPYVESAKQGAAQTQKAAAPYVESAKQSAAQTQEAAAPYVASAKDTAVAAASTATAAAAATATSAKSILPESVQKSIDQINASPSSVAGATDGTRDEPAAPQVPTTVKDSLAAAHEPAEAAVNPTAVSNKAAVERELHDTVLPDQGIDEPPGSGVPPTVTSSIAAAHASPEAAASRIAVQEKSQVESELLSSVKPAQSAGAPAPTLAAATSATAPDALVVGKSVETPLTTSSATGSNTASAFLGSGLNAGATSATTTTAALPAASAISRDVSPMTRTDEQTQPMVTTGVATGATSATTGATSTSATGPSTSTIAPGAVGASATKTAGVQNPALAAAQQASRNPIQVAPGSPASVQTEDSANSKASKRRSFFGRIKDKVTHKNRDNGESSSKQ